MTEHQSKSNNFKIRIELIGIYLDPEFQNIWQSVYVYAGTYTSFFIDLEFESQEWIKNAIDNYKCIDNWVNKLLITPMVWNSE